MKIIVFGAGNYGRRFIAQCDDEIVCIVDNDLNKQGGLLDGHKIISPSEIQSFEFDIIVIASMFRREIQRQLEGLGYYDEVAFFDLERVSGFRETKDQIVFLKDHDPLKPVLQTMHLNLTSACNIECRICKPEGDHSFKPVTLGLPDLERIVDDVFDDITHLRLDSSGELTMSPHLEYVLKEASKRKISIFISTNGTRINKRFAEMIVSSTVEHMQVSLDSPVKTVNEWIRKGAKHEDILRGARNLVEAKKALNKDLPKIHFHGAIMKQNVDHLKEMLDLSKEIGIDGVTLAYGFIHSFMRPEWSIYFDREHCDYRVQEARKHAESIGQFFNAPQPFFDNSSNIPEEKFCHYLFNWTYVDPSGLVYPCCVGAGDYAVGDIAKDNISDIWTGKRYQQLRKTYDTDKPAWEKCKHCYLMAGWNPNDYKVHFHPSHWESVKASLE